MNRDVALQEAIDRLNAALDAFEAAVHRRKANEDTVVQLEEDVHLLALDRSKLANELDTLKTRTDDLKNVNAEVSRRLDSAMATIRDVLITNGG